MYSLPAPDVASRERGDNVQANVRLLRAVYEGNLGAVRQALVVGANTDVSDGQEITAKEGKNQGQLTVLCDG